MTQWLIIGLDLVVIVLGAICFHSARRRSRGETSGRWVIRDGYTWFIAVFDPRAVPAAEYVRSVILMVAGLVFLAYHVAGNVWSG